jgi:hypothetical protein
MPFRVSSGAPCATGGSSTHVRRCPHTRRR